jgi:coatomer protein complex subunit epsilon
MSQEFINSVNYPAYNLFYLGSYSQVIHQLNNSIQSTADDKKDAKVLLYRTYLAQGKYSLISNELKGTDVEELKLIALSAELEQSSDASKREELLKQAEELANEGTNLLNPNLQLILARLAIIEGKLDIALKAVQLHPRHLEW